MSESPIRHLYPGETAQYRQARDELLEEERKLREQLARVAALRRQLPLGGEVPVYSLSEMDAVGASRQRTLGDLFGPGRDSLIVVSLVFSDALAEPDAESAALVDALQSQAVHLLQRCALAVVAKASAPGIAALGRRRGWSRLRVLSTQGTRFSADYRAETADGTPLPACNVFKRQGGKIHHFWGAELLYEQPGGASRPLDLLNPVWNYLDLTPGGRGELVLKLDYSVDLRDTLVSPRG